MKRRSAMTFYQQMNRMPRPVTEYKPDPCKCSAAIEICPVHKDAPPAVHVRLDQANLCGYGGATAPSLWPAGHTYVKPLEDEKATCSSCIAELARRRKRGW